MEHEKYFAYDKIEIPEDIMNMTSEELDAEIARLEAKVIAKKQRILDMERKDTSTFKRTCFLYGSVGYGNTDKH